MWLIIKKVQSLSQSDSGSTLSFVSVRFAKKHNLSVMGQWSGSVQTLHNTKKVSTNFYKLDFSTTNGHHAVLCLETSGLGEYFGLNYKMALKFSSHFGLAPDDLLCIATKPIDILLGIDAAALLMDKVLILNGRKVSPPAWAPNMFLYGSTASNLFTLVGRLNVNYPAQDSNKTNRLTGIFYFSDESKLVF